MEDAETFYDRLPVRQRFHDITDPASYVDAPMDWHVAVSDVRHSTLAVRDGRYKEVNMAGAACIAALLNAAGRVDLPFSFGGDGAFVLVPDYLAARSRRVLAGVHRSVRKAFQLDMRIAVVPVRAIVAAGHALRVARFQVAPEYDQAMFEGGGVSYVDALIKEEDGVHGSRFVVDPDIGGEADFEGLECRWQDIPSQHGETVTLIVTSASQSQEEARGTYAYVLDAIHRVYGDEASYRPIVRPQVRATFSPHRLSYEAKLRASGGSFRRFVYMLKILLQNVLLKLFLAFDITTGDTHWKRYVDILVDSVDYRKYDDTLRMVISGSPAQRMQLSGILEEAYEAGRLAYGLSVADRAHLTCMVFDRMGRQVHFLDGADGGYTMAARKLKERLAELRNDRRTTR